MVELGLYLTHFRQLHTIGVHVIEDPIIKR